MTRRSRALLLAFLASTTLLSGCARFTGPAAMRAGADAEGELRAMGQEGDIRDQRILLAERDDDTSYAFSVHRDLEGRECWYSWNSQSAAQSGGGGQCIHAADLRSPFEFAWSDSQPSRVEGMTDSATARSRSSTATGRPSRSSPSRSRATRLASSPTS